eukprot:scaffold93381_cov63-Phaeocystis_antarctica.AAC.3
MEGSSRSGASPGQNCRAAGRSWQPPRGSRGPWGVDDALLERLAFAGRETKRYPAPHTSPPSFAAARLCGKAHRPYI